MPTQHPFKVYGWHIFHPLVTRLCLWAFHNSQPPSELIALRLWNQTVNYCEAGSLSQTLSGRPALMSGAFSSSVGMGRGLEQGFMGKASLRIRCPERRCVMGTEMTGATESTGRQTRGSRGRLDNDSLISLSLGEPLSTCRCYWTVTHTQSMYSTSFCHAAIICENPIIMDAGILNYNCCDWMALSVYFVCYCMLFNKNNWT